MKIFTVKDLQSPGYYFFLINGNPSFVHDCNEFHTIKRKMQNKCSEKKK